MSEKLVLLYCARIADMIGSRQVRIDPARAVSELGIGVSQIDAALAGLGRANHLYAHRWSDTGAWTIKLPHLHRRDKDATDE